MNNRIKGALIFTIGAAIFGPADAQVVGAHLVSNHAPDLDYCDRNPGLYGRVGNWQAGFYRNSECDRWTVYAGYAREWEVYRGFAGGFLVGLATGYERASVIPAGALSVRTPYYHGLAARLSHAPRVPGFTDAAVTHISVEYRY